MFDLNVPTFTPHRLLRNAHAQTWAGAFLFRPAPTLPSRQQIVHLDDGDRIVLHDNLPDGWQVGDRQVVLIHGLGGSHASGYMVRTATHLSQAGIRCWRMDQRGCGAGMALARGHSHAGRREDLQAALGVVAHQAGASPTTLIGFSLGANLMLKWLANCRNAGDWNVDTAIAVSPPIDLYRCVRNLEISLNRIYDTFFCRMLRQRFQERKRYAPGMLDTRVRPLPRRLLAFDDQITAPLAGFSGALDYYRQSSAAGELDRIGIPTLLVAAADDPIVPVGMFQQTPVSGSVQTLIVGGGGHIGFVGDSAVDPDQRWLDWRIRDWMVNL